MSQLCVRVLSAMFVCLCAVPTSRSNAQSWPDSMEIRVCGRILSSTINEVCNSKFPTLLPVKKSGERDTSLNGEEDKWLEEFLQVDGVRTFPLRDLPEISVMSQPNGRFKRGIVDECCRKSCRVSEMRSYCANN